MTDELLNRLNAWVTVWLCDWVTVWLSDCVTEWLCDWVTVWLSDCVTEWLCDWVTVWLSDCVTEWLCDWVTVWLSDSQTDWLSYGPVDWQPTDWSVNLKTDWRTIQFRKVNNLLVCKDNEGILTLPQLLQLSCPQLLWILFELATASVEVLQCTVQRHQETLGTSHPVF